MLIWSRYFLILALCSKFCLKNFLRWLLWSIITLGGIQDSTTLRSRDPESITEHKPITHNLLFPIEYSMDHVNLALDYKLRKATHYNGSMFIHKVWKAVLYKSGLSITFHKGWDCRWGNHSLWLWESEQPTDNVCAGHNRSISQMPTNGKLHNVPYVLYYLSSLSERWRW